MTDTPPFPLAYCPDGHARLERLRLLFERRASDRIFGFMHAPTLALKRFGQKYQAGYCDRPDLGERAAYWDELLSERAGILDDSIPAAYLTEMDQGLYGGMVGGTVQFMADPERGWISSIVAPILSDWSGFERLRIDPEGEWFRFYLEELELFRRAGEGKFGISHFILIDGFNFLFELFGGTRSYLEAVENPELVREAIDFAHRLNLVVHQAFFDRAGLLEGGTCSNFVGWLPGRIVSESVDPFHMTSVKFFEQWGRGPAERMLTTFDGGIVHLHANGRHLLEAVSTLRGLVAVSALDDRGYASAFSLGRELKKRLGDVPLMLFAEYPDFLAALDRHTLPGGVLYRVRNVPGIDEANRCMERVREYRA